MRINACHLTVADPVGLSTFYRDYLGMRVFPRGDGVRIGYGEDPRTGTWLELSARASDNGEKHGLKPYTHDQSDIYWKIGLTLADVDGAVARLRSEGIQVSEPRQFRDIGYLGHLSDPEGFQIELLQHDFEDRKTEATPDSAFPLGGPASLGQITLRANSIGEYLRFYRDGLGMRLLSVQPVTPMGFTLYFLAFTDEQPPNPDIEAVENRSWLWRRPYTQLEIQHLHNPTATGLALPNTGELGFAGLTLSGEETTAIVDRLEEQGFDADRDAGGAICRDPGGVAVMFGTA
jgi:catechol 2,3-dioxygenase-like lactoylglutathione lyase family enzyme